MAMYIGSYIMVDISSLLQLYLSKLPYVASPTSAGEAISDYPRSVLYWRGVAALESCESLSHHLRRHMGNLNVLRHGHKLIYLKITSILEHTRGLFHPELDTLSCVHRLLPLFDKM